MLKKIINKFKRKQSSIPLDEDNVLIIASSASNMWDVIELSKNNYVTNSDPIILDNGDYALVIKKLK